MGGDTCGYAWDSTRVARGALGSVVKEDEGIPLRVAALFLPQCTPLYGVPLTHPTFSLMSSRQGWTQLIYVSAHLV
jgi:hypothetical protein